MQRDSFKITFEIYNKYALYDCSKFEVKLNVPH